VVYHGQVMVLRRLPYRLQIRMVHRLPDQEHDDHRPPGGAPTLDLPYGLVHMRRRRHNHASQAVGKLSAKVGHVPVIGPDQSHFERGVVQPHRSRP